jgi:phosphoribosyl 1,2-cyclic phosphate phosphodiesterase
LLVETDGVTFIIDAGPDFRQQLLRADVTSLDAILLTHEHKDHIAGLDDVRAFNHKSRSAIDIYSEVRVQQAIHKEYSYVFAEVKYPGVPNMRLCTVSDDVFSVGGVEIQPVRVLHWHLPVYGFRVGDFAYITDANSIPGESMRRLAGVKYFVVNAVRKEKHVSHFCLSEAIGLISELSPEKAFITHISHEMGRHADVSRELPDGVCLAFDGLSVLIDK